MARRLVLFAREPARQAREKGLESPGAADLFAAFAAGWAEAARRLGAELVIATPAEDRRAWVRRFGQSPAWIVQRGFTFGSRLENAARDAVRPGGHMILVGGDVVPSQAGLRGAFEALEDGADAAIVPAADGGISLLGLAVEDLDLLPGIARRRADVCVRLLAALRRRRRRVDVLGEAPDVDCRRDLRALSRRAAPDLAAVVRRCLRGMTPRPEPVRRTASRRADRALPILRAPPRAA